MVIVNCLSHGENLHSGHHETNDRVLTITTLVTNTGDNSMPKLEGNFVKDTKKKSDFVSPTIRFAIHNEKRYEI
jgi:hypothetical protein